MLGLLELVTFSHDVTSEDLTALR